MPFPNCKTFRELGLDPKRKFILVHNPPLNKNGLFESGDILTLEDGNLDRENPNFRRESDGRTGRCLLYRLEYYNENNSTKPSFMSDVIEFFKNLTASDAQKLRLKHGVEDPIGTPTEKGFKLSNLISYQNNLAKIDEIVASMEKEEEAKK